MELLDQLEPEVAAEGKLLPVQAQRFEVLTGRRAVLLDLGDINAARADTQALLLLAHQMADDRVWLIDALLAQAEFPANTDDAVSRLQVIQAIDRLISDRRRIVNPASAWWVTDTAILAVLDSLREIVIELEGK